MRDESRSRKILPVNLMLERRPCLVVGSGLIAARKIGHLLEAGANVTVVGPEASADIQRWLGEGRISHQVRHFRASDLKGQCVVFAATDNPKVNGEVIQLCRQKGIMCSSADAHWVQADFLIPATLRRPHLTMTISTGGESCRRARLVKDYLARHIDLLSGADLIVISIAQTCTITKRSILDLGAVLQQLWGIHEFVILNQGNRVDVLAVLSSQIRVAKLLRECVQARFTGRCCLHKGAAAMKYVAGLPSAKVLEKALGESTQAGWAGVMMREWIEVGLRLAEKKRSTKSMSSERVPLGREYQRQYESIIRSI